MADYTFDDSRLRKRVAWLNNFGGFENQIIYSKVAEAAQGLTDNKVMEILKYVEDNYDKVWDPMRWILSSLDKAKQASEGLDADVDQQLRKRIRWLNNEGGFENKIMYAKIAEAAVGLDSRKVMEVLKYLEERWEWVEDPTAWVCAALRKAATEAGGGGPARGAGGSGAWAPPGKGKGKGEGGSAAGGGKGGGQGNYDDFYDKLWRRIGWLNTRGGFDNSIQYSKIAEHSEGVDNARVMDLLSYVEENWQKIADPTAWLCQSLQTARRDGGGASAAWDEVKDRKLRTRIRWLNNEGGFENSIIYSKVAEAAQSVDTGRVMEILQNLEDNWERVGDPTAWVCSSLRRSGQSGAVDQEFDRKLRARVRWLNNEGGFENSINYSKIAQVSGDVPSERVFTALKYLEEKGPGSVEDPTSWVCAGIAKAKRAAGGGGGSWAPEDAQSRPPMRGAAGKGEDGKGKGGKGKDKEGGKRRGPEGGGK